MATTSILPPGAIAANGQHDPFVGSPTYAPHQRYASLDPEQLSMYSNSPTQARRALEAHLKDTDRRIQDASRLGTTLIQQQKDLKARLREIEQVSEDNEVPGDLRKRLADLEREYNEVGKESARAFLPRSRVSSPTKDSSTPQAFSGSGHESPTKVTAPSRRQRNQPNSRVHDIEFATEISTSLLAQVRQLQAALAEKDEELKDTSSAKAQIEADAMGMAARIKQMDDSEQRYKDENWNLETRLQELETSHKDATDKGDRLEKSLKGAQVEKAAAQRDLDDLKVSHEKLNEEHAVSKRQQETDLHGLRRDVATHETEKSTLQRRIEDLTSQNVELAKAVSYRFNQPSSTADDSFVSADSDQNLSDHTPENSEPASPVKGTPARHGMLESETLKSSLNHAHRMIQNLKNNIHREKTEKIELKRMLQDARDELETRRSDSNALGAGLGKKRRSEPENMKFKKPTSRSLGANRSSTTEIEEDEPDWEDHDGAGTPTRSRSTLGYAVAGAAAAGAGASMIPGAWATTDTESTDADAFETATERGGTTTDAFDTSREDVDDSDEMTETEGNVNRSDTVRAVSGASTLVGVKPRNRQSFQSTASLSDGDDTISTPLQAQQPKFRLRGNRASKRDRVSDLMSDSPSGVSPSSSIGTPQQAGQSLGDELDALDEGTPSSIRSNDTPQTQRQISIEPETPGWEGDMDDEPEFAISSPEVAKRALIANDEESHLAQEANAAMLMHERNVYKPQYADAGVITEPWEPEQKAGAGFRERAGEAVAGAFGGALAGFGFGRYGRTEESETGDEQEAGAGAEEMPEAARDTQDFALLSDSESSQNIDTESPILGRSAVLSQQIEPSTHEAGEEAEPVRFEFSPLITQDSEPQEPESASRSFVVPQLPRCSSRRVESPYTPPDGQDEAKDYFANGPSGSGSAMLGAGLLGAGAGAAAGLSRNDSSSPSSDLPTASTGSDPYNLTSRPLRPHAALEHEVLTPSVIPASLNVIKRTMTDGGSQTVVSGDDIESMIRNKSRAPVAAVVDAGVGASPARPTTALATSGRRSIDGTVANEPMKTPKRPASAGSMRNKAAVDIAPPLPANHEAKIERAAQKGHGTAAFGTMGPPLMPASAYKQTRPTTPSQAARTMSRDGTTPRPPRPVQSPSTLTKRSSVSSFASEIDERFNARGGLVYPEGVQPATDPRMIQAITQTMIGEYLWKYTRKAGRNEKSTTRHRRFFWIHPYTRTLYWSEKDPSTAGRDMLKAKSVAIETVRVITDDNAFPPGLHRKSIVVVTPGREIVFTAPTGQRHETWLNALSYLLLRTEQEKREEEDNFTQEDVDEFNPGHGSSWRRSISRMTGGRSHSRASLSSYNSRTTRNSSPSKGGLTLAERQSAAATRSSQQPPTLVPNDAVGTSSPRYSTVRENSNGGRLSSLTSKFRPTSAQRGSSSAARGRTMSGGSNRGRTGQNGIYDASVAADSAEELRAEMAMKEHDSDRLENVRACCDGKHDVGSLSARTGRHSSMGSRFSHQPHSHAHPRSNTMTDSMKHR